MRQTEYNYEESKHKVGENNYNYVKVIQNYLGKTKEKKEPKTVNQKFYKEIRSFMDYGSEKYEKDAFFRSRTKTSNLSSALKTNSEIDPVKRSFSLNLTTAEFRPDLLYSDFKTTIAWLSIINTFPIRSS